jgi:hypothetical protein
MTESEMLARIEALQKENNALKVQPGNGVIVKYDTYKGQPVMSLSGACPPLAFGKAKARAIVAAFEDIKRFAEGN